MWISLHQTQSTHIKSHRIISQQRAQKVIRDYSSEGKNVIPLIKDDHWVQGVGVWSCIEDIFSSYLKDGRIVEMDTQR
jgi:hypothetical protein